MCKIEGVVRIYLNRFLFLNKGQDIGIAGTGGSRKRNMKLGLALCTGVHIQNQMAQVTIYVHASGRENFAVEIFIVFLLSVKAQEVVHGYSDIDLHVFELVVCYSAVDSSCTAKRVSKHAVLENDAFFVDGNRTIYRKRHIEEVYRKSEPVEFAVLSVN